LITHLVFYGGWPSAVSAVMRAKRVFGEEKLAAPS
jgi:alkylhydroperoxidase/carboxymuconolactone decarboxylase family protein YurZ